MNPQRPLIPRYEKHELLARFFASKNVQQVLQSLDGLAIDIGNNIPATESMPFRLASNLNKRYQNPFGICQMEKRCQLGVKTLQVHPPLLAGTLGRRGQREIHRAYCPKDFLGNVDGGFGAQGKGNGITGAGVNSNRFIPMTQGDGSVESVALQIVNQDAHDLRFETMQNILE